ncbi:hypothetical protein EVAR_16922_1 [Eumeta japonica]|uniref:Uncharacterized protein n=1 Tax=Eumeta variegata TaxID=151549 RepID=A0A4C1TVD2_EUMVA|nr:hypothetical protein EVAR_16922_1 [Eumeta japonica]
MARALCSVRMAKNDTSLAVHHSIKGKRLKGLEDYVALGWIKMTCRGAAAPALCRARPEPGRSAKRAAVLGRAKGDRLRRSLRAGRRTGREAGRPFWSDIGTPPGAINLKNKERPPAPARALTSRVLVLQRLPAHSPAR